MVRPLETSSSLSGGYTLGQVQRCTGLTSQTEQGGSVAQSRLLAGGRVESSTTHPQPSNRAAKFGPALIAPESSTDRRHFDCRSPWVRYFPSPIPQGARLFRILNSHVWGSDVRLDRCRVCPRGRDDHRLAEVCGNERSVYCHRAAKSTRGSER